MAARILVVIILLAGVIIRVGLYARNDPMWSDEASLSIDIVEASPAQLLKPLDRGQAAPIGLVMAFKAVQSVFGGGEYALRAIPLLCGIATLVIAGIFAIQFLTPLQGILLAAFLALQIHLIHYSAEAKQYGPDATISLLLLWLTMRVLKAEENHTPAARHRLTAWTVAAAAAVWFSYPAVFTVAACGAAIFCSLRDKKRILSAGSLAASSFALNYFLFCRTVQRNPYLRNFWAKAMRPKGGVGPAMPWLLARFQSIGNYTLPDRAWVVGALLLAGAIGWLIQRRRSTPLLSVGGALVALLAAGLRLYPFQSRLLMFTLPGAALAMIAAAGAKARLIRYPAAALLLWSLYPMLAPVTTLHYPSASPSGLRGALAESYPSLRPGDSICVMGPTEVVFVYYRTRFDLSRQKVHIIKLPPGQEPAAAAAAMNGPRVWVLVSSAIPDYQAVPQKFLAEMDRLGRRTEYHFSGDTYMVLYEK